MENGNKTKKIGSFNDGRVWLNVIQASDGTELFTVNRSFRTQQGWKSSPFFQIEMGDLESVRQVLSEYEKSKTVVEEEVV